MIENVTSSRALGGVTSSTATSPVPELRRRSDVPKPVPTPPKDPKDPGAAAGTIKDRAYESLSDQVINAIRPTLQTQNNCRPVRMRVSLERLKAAISDLDTQKDPLLKTAHLILAEEQLRVELLRQRLQMVLEG